MLRISVQLAFWLCWRLVLIPVMGKAQRLPTQPLELLRCFLVEHSNPEQVVLGQLRTVDLDCYRSDFININRWRILHLHGVVVLVGLIGFIGRHLQQKQRQQFENAEKTYLSHKVLTVPFGVSHRRLA